MPRPAASRCGTIAPRQGRSGGSTRHRTALHHADGECRFGDRSWHPLLRKGGAARASLRRPSAGAGQARPQADTGRPETPPIRQSVFSCPQSDAVQAPGRSGQSLCAAGLDASAGARRHRDRGPECRQRLRPFPASATVAGARFRRHLCDGLAPPGGSGRLLAAPGEEMRAEVLVPHRVQPEFLAGAHVATKPRKPGWPATDLPCPSPYHPCYSSVEGEFACSRR